MDETDADRPALGSTQAREASLPMHETQQAPFAASEQVCSTCVSFRVFAVFVLFRETYFRVWEWDALKTMASTMKNAVRCGNTMKNRCGWTP